MITNSFYYSGPYFGRRVEPILSPAITYILNGNTLEENDIPELFLDYFEKCQGVATTDEWKRQQVLIAKRTPRSRVQVIRATAKIASSISTMILSLLQFRPETNIVQFLIDSMQKRPQEKENKHTSNFNTLGGLQNAKRSCLLDNPACSRTSALVGKAVATQKLIFLIIGLENSGKSTLVSVLKGQFNPNCRPSLGFRPVSLKYDDMTTIKLYDVGGGKNIRGIWNNYFHEVHGVVFVVDSACPDETLEDTVQVANSTLGHKYLQGKPLLIISNKVDKCDSRSEIVISNTLSIPIPSDGGSSKIFETSLHPKHAGYKGKPDPQIDNNMDWLIQKVISSMDDLNERMSEDIKEVKQKRLKLQVGQMSQFASMIIHLYPISHFMFRKKKSEKYSKHLFVKHSLLTGRLTLMYW